MKQVMNDGEQGFAWPVGKRAAVSLTFDDARPSQLDTGIPMLEKYGIRGTFYVTPANMEPRIAEWRGAAERGHEIGNHTMTHPCSANFPFARENALEDYTLQRIREEIEGADDFIGKHIGRAPRTFAYPCGQKYVGRGRERRSYVPLVAEGFLVGRSAFEEWGNDAMLCDLSSVNGVSMDWSKAAQLRGRVKKAVSEGRWLVLLAHDVGVKKDLSIDAAVLEDLCGYISDAETGVWFDTVAAVGEHVRQAQLQRRKA